MAVKQKSAKKILKTSKESKLLLSKKVEYYKKIIFVSGVTFFILLVMIVWIKNLNYIVAKSSLTSVGSEQAQWQKLSDNFKQVFSSFDKKANEYWRNNIQSTSSPILSAQELKQFEEKLRSLQASSLDLKNK